MVPDPSPFKAPEQQYAIFLVGKVFGHSRFPDGTKISTSMIRKIENDIVFTESGSQYNLGDVDPNYEKEYPNAKERLLTQANALEYI